MSDKRLERYKNVEKRVRKAQSQLKTSGVSNELYREISVLLAMGVQMTQERDEFCVRVKELETMKDNIEKILKLYDK